jgi:uncharacterized protein YegP (UPF0339 family)
VPNIEQFKEGAVTYKKGKDGQWYFSIRTANGETVAQSEGYTRLHSAKDGAAALKVALGVQEEDE